MKNNFSYVPNVWSIKNKRAYFFAKKNCIAMACAPFFGERGAKTTMLIDFDLLLWNVFSVTDRIQDRNFLIKVFNAS